jgi:molecular chaperone HscB
MDPFETLGVARRYDVDLAKLEKVHRDLSRALHPDRYAAATPSERRAALEKATRVNEAFRVVRDPVRRAEALFQLAGVPVGEANEPKADPAFLMEVLEQREALAEAKAEKDRAKVEALADAMRTREQAAQAALAAGFASETASPRLVARLGELRFYRRFLEEASGILDEWDDGAL